jgi:hypothetical protein
MSPFVGCCCDCGRQLTGIRRHRFISNPNRRCSKCYTATILPEGSERQVHTDGYVEIKIAGKWMLKHRHVMKQKLGRRLLPKEVVHHRDEERSNNEEKNLILCESAGRHVQQYHPEALKKLLAFKKAMGRRYQQHVYCKCGFQSRRIERNGTFGNCPNCYSLLATSKR